MVLRVCRQLAMSSQSRSTAWYGLGLCTAALILVKIHDKYKAKTKHDPILSEDDHGTPYNGRKDTSKISSEWASRLRVATTLAMEAGQAMRDTRGASQHGDDVSYKGRHDLVTKTDRSNEELIQRGLKEAFPDDHFLGEEASADRGGAPAELSQNFLTWIVDPIDGTTNFVHGFPVTCVSIGLARGEEVLVGVIYNPFTAELYQATKDSGSSLNGTRLEVSGATWLDQALVVAEYSYLRDKESLRKMMQTTGRITRAARAVRQTGCGAMDLCYLARGSVDAVYGGVAGVWKPWDWAAGILIAQEAGATILSGDGSSAFKLMGDTILGAATPELANALSQTVDG